MVTLSAVLIERGPGEWVGQYLEHDLGAQASTFTDLVYELQRTLIGHLAICVEKGVQPFTGLDRAPQEYWDLWNTAEIRLDTETFTFRTPTLKSQLNVKVAKAA